jgi:hypothetical protein
MSKEPVVAEAKKTKAPAPQEGDKPAEAAAPKPKKTMMLVGGSAFLATVLGVLAATMAVPVKKPEPRLEGPFIAKLSSSDIQVNLAGEGSKRYLVCALQAEYHTYDESYVSARIGGGGAKGGGEHSGGATEDPLYAAMLKDALIGVAATKTRDEVTNPVLVESFLEEVRKAIDPVLFPVCIGDAKSMQASDSLSGLRTGESNMQASLRGLLYEHALHVDGPRRTLRLDNGPVVQFEGREHDLRVVDGDDKDIYVDVSALKPGFLGDIHVGVAGKVRRIYRDSFLVQ